MPEYAVTACIGHDRMSLPKQLVLIHHFFVLHGLYATTYQGKICVCVSLLIDGRDNPSPHILLANLWRE
jgi:hypothetical protein